MTSRDAGVLLLLSAVWGGSFLFMRVAAPSLGPVFLIAVRLVLAGLTLLGLAAATRSLPPLDRRWPDYLVLGLINSSVPFILISTAELHLPASLAAVLNATTPLFTAVVAAVWTREPVPFALPSAPASPAVVASVVLLALPSTALAYFLYYQLLARVGPARATLVSYLVPAFGMLWGALFLGEILGVSTFLGFGLIAGSVMLVSGGPSGRTEARPLRASAPEEG